MKYKMLVIDMDDTLLTDDHIISEENKEMLLKRRKRSLCYFGIGETQAMIAHAKELKNWIICI
jgi:hydroxymethylpyrimidine pyrophosphatase-like HAD family hydrolase